MRETELRPLGAGELLDRAITLLVRFFPRIAAAVAIMVIPISILNALLQPHAIDTYADIGRVLGAAGNPSAQRAALEQLQAHGASGQAVTLLLLVTMAISLLGFNAVSAIVAAANRGASLGLAPAYALAARLWPRQVLVSLAFAVIGLVALLALLVVYFFGFLVVFGVAAVLRGLPSIVVGAFGVVVVIIVLVVLVAAVSWFSIAYTLASVAIVTEGLGVGDAISAGLRRAFGRRTAIRALVAGLIVNAVLILGSLPFGAVALTVGALLHAPVLAEGVNAVGQIILDALIVTFAVVFAADVRVRREGLDLFAETVPA
ncbi:MAG: hypothetical protein ABR975_01930 [Vulcanimicrobiaceae bacterium]